VTTYKPFEQPRQPVQERARRTRERLLEAAALVFARDGYERASLNGLIRESGLTKGAFYHHFSSKEELALATFRYKQEQLLARARELMPQDVDAVEELRAVIRVRARLYAEDPSLRCILRLGAELGATAGPGSDFAGYQDLAIETFAGIVRRGQQERSIRPEIDPRSAGEAIFAAVVGADRLSRMLTGSADLEQRGQQLVDLLVHGLAQPRPPRRRR